jgi:hypothetical protein
LLERTRREACRPPKSRQKDGAFASGVPGRDASRRTRAWHSKDADRSSHTSAGGQSAEDGSFTGGWPKAESEDTWGHVLVHGRGTVGETALAPTPTLTLALATLILSPSLTLTLNLTLNLALTLTLTLTLL